MNILKPPAKSALESEMEQTVAKYAAVEAAAKKVADVSGKSSLEMALGSGSALRIQAALEQSLHMETQIKRFGSRLGPLPENAMRSLEERIPELAVKALNQAYSKALASGMPVVEAINGNLVETTADGQRRIIGSLPAPYKVEPGKKRMRRIEK